ncbi:S8 family peptidase [Alteribacter natronophilus]|uniref:S8 family peptidase n=1 Tax=Alteribacter natronophilus TaxID=2583810 RepID=UPI00110E02B9|nr:S8 family peptidase [Alteribacter natronophilus]TMW70996.1 peptidase S8 [Alteribacter natronophilus]
MKKFLAAVITAAMVTVPFQAGASNGAGDDLQEYLVQFNGAPANGLLQAFGVSEDRVLTEFNHLDVVNVELSEAQARGLSNNPHVEAVEENAEVHALGQTVPWGIPHVQGTDAQDAGYTGAGLKVAILDTGIEATHEDLADNVKGGYSVFTDADNSDPYYDPNGHGTHVAGTVAAVDNDLGVIGVAPEADLYAVKVLSNAGSGSIAGIAEGIEWSIDNDMDIINMSLGASQGSSILEQFSNLAYDEGLLVVAAAGNSGNRGGNNNTVGYPAAYDSVIAVAAVDQNNNRATFSSTGPAVEISAPGVNVLSTTPGDNYASYNGTSMASPHVAGVAAQVWQAKPGLSNTELRQLLNDTAVNLGPAHQYGHGLVQSLDAINQ